MKELLLIALLPIAINSCERSVSESCSYNGHTLYTGEKGGCYYLSSGRTKNMLIGVIVVDVIKIFKL